MGTQILGNNNGGTQIINNNGGTQVLNSSNPSTATGGESTFTGGLLRIGEIIAGCCIQSKMNTSSGEADLYVASKDGKKFVVKYYRSKLKAKTDVLEKLKGLNHPDIVNVLDYGYYRDRFFEVMEFAEGGAINDKNSDGSYKYLPFTEEQAIQMCREVVNAYKFCHENGIIHRDIKPANIYFKNADGTDFIIGDFGISSIMEADELIHKTQTASRTTGYAAKEVLSGLISPAMDYYALGITLWEVLNAKDPFLLENGQRRNDAHLLRDTIEGRIADDLLSRKPFLSEKMQRLIRGLLVVDSTHRWGYSEVTRFLNGEDVPVFVPEKKYSQLKLGDKRFDTLEELGTEIMKNPDYARRDFERSFIADTVAERDEELAKKIIDIQEKSTNLYNSLIEVACLLNPALPIVLDNGFKVNSIEDVLNLVDNAPESISSYIFDTKSKLYVYLSIIGCENEASELKKCFENISRDNMSVSEIAEKMAFASVILRGYKIKPFVLAKYKDVELYDIEQLKTIPDILKDYVMSIIKGGSTEKLLLPWLKLKVSTDFSKATSWKELISCLGI